MIKSLLKKLFFSNKKRDGCINNLKTIPGFRTLDEIENDNSNDLHTLTLEKGEIQPLFSPDFGNQKGFKLTKWYFKIGSVIQAGDVICDIENEHLLMEFESAFAGKIISACPLNMHLRPGMELCKIEGL
ncbi:biotin/lipoyl-containing protein [Spongiimicrobium sp. 2-473A-2-J]|uniref:biotin/lipoyl-containing protein n=1 Tax=Eudoraea algarum TaxID=3417568 RepID=UPI003D35DF11